MSPYAQLYRELNKHTVSKRRNRSVVQIIRRIMFPVSIASVCEYDVNSHTHMLRNDLLARAFLLTTEGE